MQASMHLCRLLLQPSTFYLYGFLQGSFKNSFPPFFELTNHDISICKTFAEHKLYIVSYLWRFVSNRKLILVY